jgi:hypothetical protein
MTVLNTTENQQNSDSILCDKCSTLILKPLSASLCQVDQPEMLPPTTTTKIKESIASLDDSLADSFINTKDNTSNKNNKTFWKVKDMYTFENIGFTHPVKSSSSQRYLCCAECEIGPLGYQSITNELYLATDRVIYKSVV